MFKRQKRMIFIMGLLFMIYLSSCKKVDTDIMESITLEDGQTYIYMEYPNEFTYEIKGVDIETASRQQLLNIFNNDIESIKAVGMISGSEQAVGHGISILNKTFEDWTYTNNVGVGFNERANIWFVHGKKKDRESSNKSGLIIFDAATGEVLGIGLY